MYKYISSVFFIILLTLNLMFPPSALAESELQKRSLAQIQTPEQSMSP